MVARLTAAAAERIKPGAARMEHPDGGAPGLRLLVHPSGKKMWIVRFRRPGGKPAKLTLGPLDLTGREAPGEPTIGMPLTVAGARRLAAEVMRQKAQGRDPAADHQATRRRVETGEGTFGAACRRYVVEYCQPKNRGWREVARVLGLDDKLQPIPGGVCERWDARLLMEFTNDDHYALVDESVRRGIPGLQARTEGRSDARGRSMSRALSKFFAWCVQHRLLVQNPAAGQYCPPPPPARDRVLTEDEIRKVWTAAGVIGQPFGPLVRLLLLTGCRVNEVCKARSDELKPTPHGLDLWIPKERTKNKRPHVVPLSTLAREVLDGVQRVEGELVFTTTGRTPVSGFSRAKRRLDAQLEGMSWRLHDLRRTAATGMIQLGTQPHVVELCLNHVSGARAGVAGVYNRAEMLDERRSALERWGEHVRSLVDTPVGRGIRPRLNGC